MVRRDYPETYCWRRVIAGRPSVMFCLYCRQIQMRIYKSNYHTHIHRLYISHLKMSLANEVGVTGMITFYTVRMCPIAVLQECRAITN